MPSRVASSIFETVPWNVGGSLGEGDGGSSEGLGPGALVVGGGLEGGDVAGWDNWTVGLGDGDRMAPSPTPHPTDTMASIVVKTTNLRRMREMVASSGNADRTSGQRSGYAFR